MPAAKEVVRQALTTIAAAVLAALIIGQVPQLKVWIKEQWR